MLFRFRVFDDIISLDIRALSPRTPSIATRLQVTRAVTTAAQLGIATALLRFFVVIDHTAYYSMEVPLCLNAWAVASLRTQQE